MGGRGMRHSRRATAGLFLVVAAISTPMSIAEEPIDSRLSAETLAAFKPAVFQSESGFDLSYRLLEPIEVLEGENYPLLLFLHGFGERGSDNQVQLVHGGKDFADEAFRRRHPAYVLAPQCPDGTEPGTVSRNPKDPPGSEAQRVWNWGLEREGSPSIDVGREPTRQLRAVRELVDRLRATHPVDDRRLYVCGLSMGGYATWELITREPDLWAAAAPICGAGDPLRAGRLADVPVWNFHGDQDGAIPVERSREIVSALEAVGAPVIYTEYAGVGHDSWTPTLASRYVWDWLFAQRR